MKWEKTPRGWQYEKRRITLLGMPGDDRRYACYDNGKYLGSEETFNEARKRALSGIVRDDSLADADDGVPRFARLTDEERKQGWVENPPRPKFKIDPLRTESVKPVKEKKEKKEKVRKRPSREGLITVASIAAEMKIEASEARAILREAGVEKPAAGWAGDEKWAKNIRKVIVKELPKRKQ